MPGFLSTSPVGDLSCVPSDSGVVTGRKTWKTSKEKNEAVWPPHLEGNLIQGLEIYRPDCKRPTKDLRRFPKRNRWLSEYILSNTGQLRTAKQVSSRLQQLRGTGDLRILYLLSRREYPDLPAKKISAPRPSRRPSGLSESSISSASLLSFSSRSPSPSTCTSVESYGPPLTIVTKSDVPQETTIISPPSPPQTVISIDLRHQRPPLHANAGSYAYNRATVYPAETTIFQGKASLRESPHRHEVAPRHISLVVPRPLRTTAPNVTFVSSTVIPTSSHFSFFRVLLDRVHVHSERTNIFLLPSAPRQAGDPVDTGVQFVYGTRLIPEYWLNLCQNADLKQCTIVQEIYKTSSHHTPCPASTSIPAGSVVILSFVYNFTGPSQLALPEEQSEYEAPTATAALRTSPLPSGFTDPPLYPFTQSAFSPSELSPDVPYPCPTVDDQSDHPVPSTHTLPNAGYTYSWNTQDIPDAHDQRVTGHTLLGDAHSHYRGAASLDCHAQYYPIQDMDALYDVRDSHPYHPYRRTYPTYGVDGDWSNMSSLSAYSGH